MFDNSGLHAAGLGLAGMGMDGQDLAVLGENGYGWVLFGLAVYT